MISTLSVFNRANITEEYDNINKIYILLDGVTVDRIDGKYPNPSPARDVAHLFGEYVYKILSTQIDLVYPELAIKKAIYEGNLKIKEYNNTYNPPFDAGVVGIVSIIKDDIFYYSYIGDCSGRIFTEDYIDLFTIEQTRMVRENKKSLTTYEIRHIICNNINHPYGYGVWDGKSGALDFVVSGTKKISNGAYIVLSSDGYEELLSKLSFADIKLLLPLNASVVSSLSSRDDKSIIIIH